MECKNLFDCIDGLYDKYVDLWTEICNMETPTMRKELVDRLGGYFVDFAKQKPSFLGRFYHLLCNLIQTLFARRVSALQAAHKPPLKANP